MTVKAKSNKSPLGITQLHAVAELFNVLSEPTRLRILQLLHDGPASVGEIVHTLGIKQANASKQLAILHHAAIVAREKDGNSVRYSIAMPLVMDLCTLVCHGLRQSAQAKLKMLA